MSIQIHHFLIQDKRSPKLSTLIDAAPNFIADGLADVLNTRYCFKSADENRQDVITRRVPSSL